MLISITSLLLLLLVMINCHGHVKLVSTLDHRVLAAGSLDVLLHLTGG